MNWFLVFKVYWIWPCLTKPCAWLFPNPKHRQNTLRSIERSPPSKCLQKMRDQVKKDLVFIHTRSLYWIFIQDKVKSWPKQILKDIGSFVWTRMSIFFDLIMIAFVVHAFHIECCFHVLLWKKILILHFDFKQGCMSWWRKLWSKCATRRTTMPF